MEIHMGPSRYLDEAGECPVCHCHLDGYGAVSTEPTEDWDPKPGDYTVCLKCATVLRYEIGMQYSQATRDDLKELQEHQPECFTMLSKLIWAASQCASQRRGEKRMKGRRKRWH